MYKILITLLLLVFSQKLEAQSVTVSRIDKTTKLELKGEVTAYYENGQFAYLLDKLGNRIIYFNADMIPVAVFERSTTNENIFLIYDLDTHELIGVYNTETKRARYFDLDEETNPSVRF